MSDSLCAASSHLSSRPTPHASVRRFTRCGADPPARAPAFPPSPSSLKSDSVASMMLLFSTSVKTNMRPVYPRGATMKSAALTPHHGGPELGHLSAGTEATEYRYPVKHAGSSMLALLALASSLALVFLSWRDASDTATTLATEPASDAASGSLPPLGRPSSLPAVALLSARWPLLSATAAIADAVEAALLPPSVPPPQSAQFKKLRHGLDSDSESRVFPCGLFGGVYRATA
mmetsp:Transcript_8514/g.34613  ORF Transcript_8514/g.34613 Transcript_8514/m.34613 type:complete len:232 (+) Transcript_8514:307-1002(+)